MTKYYFVSYKHCDGQTTIIGCCCMKIQDTNLNGIIDFIQQTFKFSQRPVVISLKDLTKEEYEMLKGDENE